MLVADEREIKKRMCNENKGLSMEKVAICLRLTFKLCIVQPNFLKNRRKAHINQRETSSRGSDDNRRLLLSACFSETRRPTAVTSCNVVKEANGVVLTRCINVEIG